MEDGTVPAIVEKYGLNVERIHTHIGSGSDPAIWQEVATKSLSFCKIFPSVTALNLGGGYKVGRNPGEPTTDLQEIGKPVADAFRTFAEENNGRELKLEIEPGTYLVAMAGALVSTVQDKVFTTGDAGHGKRDKLFFVSLFESYHYYVHTILPTEFFNLVFVTVFLKMDAGMTDVLRPSLYGAIHPITIFPGSGKTDDVGDYVESVVVVGHCCESGDLMTPQAGEPEALGEREVRKAEIGDIIVMDGSGAYCAGMSTKNYNSFPEAPEVLVGTSGDVHLIRARQPVEQIWANECTPDNLL